jgi:hypothetical protein
MVAFYSQSVSFYELLNRQSEVEQDRQCTYDVQLWHVRVTVVLLETTQCSPCAVDTTFYIIAALPDDGRRYRPKHVVVNVTNGYRVIYNVVLIGGPITTLIE